MERRDGKMMKKLHNADRERVYLLNSISTCRMFLLLQDRADERDHRSVQHQVQGFLFLVVVLADSFNGFSVGGGDYVALFFQGSLSILLVWFCYCVRVYRYETQRRILVCNLTLLLPLFPFSFS